MFSGEAEIQARRRTLAVLQDEARRVLDSARDLPAAFTAAAKGDASGVQQAIERIRKAEEDVTGFRRMLTRELAEIGTMMMNREDFLRTAYSIEQIAGYVSAIAFKFSQLKASVLKRGLGDGVRELVDMAVEAVHRLNEIVRALSINPITAIDLSNSVQKIERQIDDKYRDLTVKCLKELDSFKELLVLRDILQGVEDLADRCLEATDSVTIVALGL